MIIIYTISYILLISVTIIDARSCTTPDGQSGTCVSIYDYKPLLDIAANLNSTKQDIDFLLASKCSYENNVLMVCSPISKPSPSCVTPHGKPGQCISMHSCSHILHLMMITTAWNKTDYIKKSVCNGSEKNSVCCGPPPEIEEKSMTPNEICYRALTNSPPERNSNCCGLQESGTSKIVGGSQTKITDYPWLSVIEYIQQGVTKLLCGGSLISAKYVLTAKHCVTGRILSIGTPKNVRLGDYNTTSIGPDCVRAAGGGRECTHPVVILPIEKSIWYPESGHDIALIKLKIGAFYTDFIRPICLPSVDYTINPPVNFKLLVAGWGIYEQLANGTDLYSDVKQHVEVPYVGGDKCHMGQERLWTKYFFVYTSGILCAGGDTGKDSCKGDSGGPLMYEVENTLVIVGVVSSGPKICGKTNSTGTYMNVYKYLPWIISTIET